MILKKLHRAEVKYKYVHGKAHLQFLLFINSQFQHHKPAAEAMWRMQ